MTNENHFPKTISQWEFDYGLFTNLPRIIVTCDFSPRYPNLKTTCHIKLKFFLWTKLIENLLLAKYLISVATPLIDSEDTWIASSAIYRLNSTGLKILPCGTPNIGQSVNFLFSIFRYWQRFIRLMQIILMELFND